MGREFYALAPPHPEVQRRIDTVRDATLAAGKLVMAAAVSGDAARGLIDQGIQLVVVQFGQFFRSACTTYLQSARSVR